MKKNYKINPKNRLIITANLLLALVFFLITPNIYADLESKHQEVEKLKSFVESGLDYINKYGKNKAYAEFNNPNGKFRQGNLYLFVYSNEGNCLADGNIKSRIGKNFLNEKDLYGTSFLKLMLEVVKKGGGFLSYYWPEPTTHEIHIKTSYIKAVDKNSFIGAGVYKLMDVPKLEQVRIEEIKAFVNHGIEYFQKHDPKEAFQEFINPNGKFRIDDKYLFVINYQGVYLAHGVNSQSYIGKNLYNKTDEFGTPYVQLLIETAKNGGGFVTYYSPDPMNGKIELKTSYVKPLTDNTLIASGIYEKK